MALLGVNLQLLIGPTIAVPAPLPLVENFERAEVTTSDSGRSGFQLVFAAGRAGRADLVDFPLLAAAAAEAVHAGRAGCHLRRHAEGAHGRGHHAPRADPRDDARIDPHHGDR